MILRKVLITAGPTREMLDPVRFLSNLSTGEMGYTLARIARRKGFHVTLISGPTALRPPAGVRFIPITSAIELQKACQKEFPKHDALVMTAAVCDFTAQIFQKQKIQRTKTHRLALKQTPDILAGLAAARKKHQIVIGFCLETRDWLKRAKEKLNRKHLDGIVANYYTSRHVPFGNRRLNTAFVASKVRMLRNVNKTQISLRLIQWLDELASAHVKNR